MGNPSTRVRRCVRDVAQKHMGHIFLSSSRITEISLQIHVAQLHRDDFLVSPPPPSPQRPPPCSPTFCGLFGVYMYTPASIHVYESYSPTQDFENNIQKLSKQNLEEKKHTWNIYISCAINCLLHLHTSITVHQW